MASSKPRWIWYNGDFEIYHSLLLHSRRQELGHDYPTMWHTDSPYPTVQFKKDFIAKKAGTLEAIVNGPAYVVIDGEKYATGVVLAIPEGEHSVLVRITKPDGLPCLFVNSDVCPSDDTWQATPTHTSYIPVGADPAYEDSLITPETFIFNYEHLEPTNILPQLQGYVYDFGREIFGKLTITGAHSTASLGVYYGESLEEALDTENTLVREQVSGKDEYMLVSRAFRYIYVKGAAAEIKISAEYEYLPLKYKGNFSSDSTLLNRIWDLSAYTFHLNSREFFLDGIKRDRWVWSGDAFQSYMVNNYLFFDRAITRRTIIALRGKDPVQEHINTILDYSLYWIISLYHYYMTYADLEFVRLQYPKMKTLLDYCSAQVEEHGFIIGLPGDWVFIDWSEMDKDGPLCAEQMLFARSFEVMAKLSQLLQQPYEEYERHAIDLKEKINTFYWNPEKGAYIDSFVSGKENVTRHGNIFAVMFGIAGAAQTQSILDHVLKNDAITPITTPYFKFFELDVMCSLGELKYATDLMLSYWGGMVKLGATSIWELYDPSEEGSAHYAMYGMKYGKSLCHAWGGGPIYLLGRYYLGVTPTKPGYEAFDVIPNLGGLHKIDGIVPIEGGEVSISLDEKQLTVVATKDGGTLKFAGLSYSLKANHAVTINYEAPGSER